MIDGRTVWYPEDACWLDWESIVILGEELGPGAVSVLVALKGEAKRQNAGWKLKTGFHSLARRAFIDVKQARSIVDRAAELGVLDDLEIADLTFTCRISGMAASEQRARDAARKAAERAVSQAQEAPQVRAGHIRTHPDTPGQNRTTRTEPDLQERREEKEEGSSLRSEPAASHGDATVVRGLFDHWREHCDHPQAKLTPDRRRKVGARLREGYTPQQIRTAIDGAARAAFVDDSGKRHDDIELICRNGSKLESFIARATNGGQKHADEMTNVEYAEFVNSRLA